MELEKSTQIKRNARNAKARGLFRRRKYLNSISLEVHSRFDSQLLSDQADCRSSGDRIVLQGEADQTHDQDPGDLIFVLSEVVHDIFERSGADLLADVHITLAESLCGLSRVLIKHLDGRGIAIDHRKPKGGILRPGQLLRVDGEGMPIKKQEKRGNLFLRIIVDFPEDDYLQDQTITTKLAELLPKPASKIKADTTDEVTYDSNASPEDFGSTDVQGGDAWEDEEDEETGPGAGVQCPQQ